MFCILFILSFKEGEQEQRQSSETDLSRVEDIFLCIINGDQDDDDDTIFNIFINLDD